MKHRFIKRLTLSALLSLFCTGITRADILVPMDLSQTDHLKAYGLTYKILQAGGTAEWLLNYRGGSFLYDDNDSYVKEARLMGVKTEHVSASEVVAIHARIEQENMEVVILETAPKVAIYTPPNASPWDDAVTIVFNYAEIEYDKIWDQEVMEGALSKYDWLHLHHEDFTGQYSKFFTNPQARPWMMEEMARNEEMANKFSFDKVWKLKQAVTRRIAEYVNKGGFLFAMCLATETFEISLATQGIDIVPQAADGDGVDPNANSKLNFDNNLAFENFQVVLDASINSFSTIDGHQVNNPPLRQPLGYISLFKFSAKYDPLPTLLTQNHTDIIKGYYGQSTSFNRSCLKDGVTILGYEEGKPFVNYIHGNYGEGTWSYLGGHDPEDPEHRIGDPPTKLELKRNSPGYRLILNNLLFPAAQKKELKT